MTARLSTVTAPGFELIKPAAPARHKPRGRHPQHRLSAVTIRQTKRPGRYADGHGLYLVVDPSGAKRWIWRGVIQGKRADLGLGSTSLVSLADARAQALTIRKQARAGENPRRERQRVIVPTFKAVALDVHKEHSASFKNAKHSAQWITTLETYAFPILGNRPITAIAAPDVLAVLSPIWLTKPETARRVKQRIKLVFAWAIAKQYYRSHNPTDGLTKVLPKHKDDKEHHKALAYADVPAFVTNLRTAADMNTSIRLGLELLILTATRTNELQGATWDEIDFTARTWTIPAARMKAGRAHVVPLVPRAIAILEAARDLGSAFLFPGQKRDRPLSNMTFLKAARRLTKAPLTVHGFRSSFRDWSAECTNVPREVCEAALAHTVKDKVEAAYKRTTLLDKRRALMEQWAQFAAPSTEMEGTGPAL